MIVSCTVKGNMWVKRVSILTFQDLAIEALLQKCVSKNT